MKIFVQRIKSIRVKTLLISIIVAIFLWMYVKLGDTYKYSLDIPVEPVNVKPGKTVKNELPQNITILVEGKGSSLMGLLLFWKSDIKFPLDLSTIEYFWDCELNNYLNWIKLPPGYEKVVIKEITKPEFVTIELDKLLEKKVPLEPEEITVIPSEHYVQVGKIQFMPDSILISGPASKISKIDRIVTETLKYKNKKKPFEDYALIKKEYEGLFTYSLEEVNFRVDVQVLGERVLEAVDVVVTDIPAGYKVRVEPGTVNVKIRGGINFINSISKNDITVEIPWKKEWRRLREYREKLVIWHPEDIISYDELPKIFTVIIG